MDIQRHEPIGGLARGADLKWCVVVTAGREDAGFVNAAAQGFQCYFPRYWAKVKCSRTRPNLRRDVARPLFPGYFFAGYGAGTPDWRRLFSTPGVRDVPRSSDAAPHHVEFLFLARLAGCEDQWNSRVKVDRRHWPFKPGDAVRIVDGSFTGFYAKLTSLDDDGRIGLLLDILGGVTPIKGMTAEQIEAV